MRASLVTSCSPTCSYKYGVFFKFNFSKLEFACALYQLQKKYTYSFFIECCQIRPDVSNGLFSDSKAQILGFCPPVSQTQNRSHVKFLVMQPIHLLSNTIKTFPNIIVLFHLFFPEKWKVENDPVLRWVFSAECLVQWVNVVINQYCALLAFNYELSWFGGNNWVWPTHLEWR